MKRFTETTKWEDPWFRKLKPKYKAFFLFVCDRCDNAGVWVVDMDLAIQYIGEKLEESDCLKVMGGRVVDMGRGRWLIPQFIDFQYGALSLNCHPHKRIMEAMSRHGLKVEGGRTTLVTTLVTTLPTTPVEEDKEEEEDKDKEEDSLPLGDVPPPPPYDPANEVAAMAVDVLTFLNKETGQSFRIIETHLESIRARIKEVHGDVEGIKQMIRRRWEEARGTESEKYMNPTTLFRPGNFATWYDQRNIAVYRGKPDHRADKAAREFPENIQAKQIPIIVAK
jgi:uncharacterized phage protein (TIGR02220 family)